MVNDRTARGPCWRPDAAKQASSINRSTWPLKWKGANGPGQTRAWSPRHRHDWQHRWPSYLESPLERIKSNVISAGTSAAASTRAAAVPTCALMMEIPCPVPVLVYLTEAEWRLYASVNWCIIGSDKGLSPDLRQVIIRINTGILLPRTLGTNFNEIIIEVHTFSSKKICMKMSAKWRTFCLGLRVLHFLSAKLFPPNTFIPWWL